MDIIYYYSGRRDAPGEVSRNIFDSLYKSNLPFNIKVFPQNKDAYNILKNRYDDIDVISYKDLFKIKNSIVHISISPLVFPNRKFLLHLLSIIQKNKIILNYHGDQNTELMINLFKMHKLLNLIYLPNYFISPYLMQNAKAIIVNSYSMQKLMNERYNLKNILVIPNAIESSWADPAPTHKLEGKPSIFYHGRLSPEKGVDMLIKAFLKISRIKSLNTAKLYIAGDGPLEKDLKRLTINYGMERNIFFLGHIDKHEIKSHLMGADAAIYPSTFDTFSLAVLEALATVNGPVYYSNLTGIHNFIKLNGYTFNAFSPNVDNISIILNDIIESNNKDIKLINQQKQFSKEYTWEKVSKQYIDLYKSISKNGWNK